MAEDRSEEFDGYSVSFVSIRQTHDLAAMLEGLPGDSCQPPGAGVEVPPERGTARAV